MAPLRRLLTSALSAVAAIAIAVTGCPIPAAADDDPVPVGPLPVGPPPAGPVLALADIGALAPLSFFTNHGKAGLIFPVPPGLVPEALTATVELPADIGIGTVTVSQDDRTITRVALPATDMAPISIPLAGAEIVDNSVTLQLRTDLSPPEGRCPDLANPVRLTNGAVAFAGVESPPSTIADFLPPVLRKLTIAIPATPTMAESDAAIRLSAAVVAHYGAQPTIVEVVPTEPAPPPSLPFERQIVIAQGPAAGLALQPGVDPIPRLRISGSDNDLTNQARLLSADVSRLAISSEAVAGPLTTSPQLPGDVTTLTALGQAGASAVALSPRVSIGVDQTRLGRAAHSVRLQLKGSYTPIPASVSARLVANIGDETIAQWPTDATGAIDRWVSIPDRLLRRYTTVDFALNVAGNVGRCDEFLPLTLTVDGDSVVQSEPAVPPLPGGFQSLPQALMPRVEIGIGADAFADTVRAAAIVVGLQRMVALPLYTVATELQKAIDSPNPAILIAADGWNHPEIPLPLSATDSSVTLQATDESGAPTTLTLNPTLRYGSLQTFFEGGRSVLVATSNAAPGELDELLRWLGADGRRWPRLDGTVLIAAPGRQPVTVRPQSGTSDTATEPGDTENVWWAVAGVTAAALIGYAFIWRQSRRATSER